MLTLVLMHSSGRMNMQRDMLGAGIMSSSMLQVMGYVTKKGMKTTGIDNIADLEASREE